jgi:apolipoprotein N-acyltransferase
MGAALLEVLALAATFLLAFRFPAASGHGWLEAGMALLCPALLFGFLAKGRRAGWIYLALFLGLVGIFHWVPRTVEVKGGQPFLLSLLAGALFFGYEALGFLAVAWAGRWGGRRVGPWGAAFLAALSMLLWEAYAFHVYAWSWGATLGGLPWLARSAAFLGTHGLAALLWGAGAYAGTRWALKGPRWPALAAPLALAAILAGSGLLWRALPRGPERRLDVVIVQPNFEPGVRRPGMEEELWARSDAELRRGGLPRPGTATLLLWPESAVLGRDDREPSPRLAWEARRRGIGWLFGTEGGPYNLVRGETGAQAPFLQAKVEPMAFGERMPGPAGVRRWLDHHLGFLSQEPGILGPGSSFPMPTPQGPLKVHPLICSEALLARRLQEGLAAAGGDLISNHTNDGWFEESPATDLHAAQIRLRAVEAGLPLLRATLTGKSGIFREDGTWELWGKAMSEGAYTVRLAWRPIATPARSPRVLQLFLAFLALGSLLALRRPGSGPLRP